MSGLLLDDRVTLFDISTVRSDDQLISPRSGVYSKSPSIRYHWCQKSTQDFNLDLLEFETHVVSYCSRNHRYPHVQSWKEVEVHRVIPLSGQNEPLSFPFTRSVKRNPGSWSRRCHFVFVRLGEPGTKIRNERPTERTWVGPGLLLDDGKGRPVLVLDGS